MRPLLRRFAWAVGDLLGALSVMIYFVSEALRRLSDYLSYHHDNPWEDTPWAIEHSDDSSVARPASTSRPHR